MRWIRYVAAVLAIGAIGFVALGGASSEKKLTSEECAEFVGLLSSENYRIYDPAFLRAAIRTCVREGTLTRDDVADLKDELGEFE